MTETNWLSSVDPESLLHWVLRKMEPPPKQRKMRLFCRACCERLLPPNPPHVYLRALKVLEEQAEGRLNWAAVEALTVELTREQDALDRITAIVGAIRMAYWDAEAIRDPIRHLQSVLPRFRGAEEPAKICDLLRDIFGNPFRPIEIDPRWQSSTVRDLARAIEAESAYERMPILADALMDAGCDSEEILAHCRGEGPHVRGCWVIDSLLGNREPLAGKN